MSISDTNPIQQCRGSRHRQRPSTANIGLHSAIAKRGGDALIVLCCDYSHLANEARFEAVCHHLASRHDGCAVLPLSDGHTARPDRWAALLDFVSEALHLYLWPAHDGMVGPLAQRLYTHLAQRHVPVSSVLLTQRFDGHTAVTITAVDALCPVPVGPDAEGID